MPFFRCHNVPMAMASEKVFFILQALAEKMREKIHSRIFSLSFLPAFLFFFSKGSEKEPCACSCV